MRISDWSSGVCSSDLLGVSQSALSHTIRGLEERLGVRLLNRTTRNVSPTEAGERLLHGIGPRFDEIEAEVAAVRELREKPAGPIPINAPENKTAKHLLPKNQTETNRVRKKWFRQ